MVVALLLEDRHISYIFVPLKKKCVCVMRCDTHKTVRKVKVQNHATKTQHAPNAELPATLRTLVLFQNFTLLSFFGGYAVSLNMSSGHYGAVHCQFGVW